MNSIKFKALFFIILTIFYSCYVYDNPIDPEAVNYQGYNVVATVNEITAENPVDGTSIVDATPKLKWDAVIGALEYNIQVSSNTDFNVIIEKDNMLTNPEYQMNTILTIGQIYYWRIKSINTSGVLSSWSSVWSFAIDPAIGTNYAGGIVFYLNGRRHGLVAAASDQSTGVEWGVYGTLVGGTSKSVETGAANTMMIVNVLGSGTYAAKICADLVLNGYNDWFLPSKNELNLMYKNLKMKGLGDFIDSIYWSSSEYSSEMAWGQEFDNGSLHHDVKDAQGLVHAVRAF